MTKKWIVSALLLLSTSTHAMQSYPGPGLHITWPEESSWVSGLGGLFGGMITAFHPNHNNWIAQQQAEKKRHEEEVARLAREAETKKRQEREDAIARSCESKHCKTHPDYRERMAEEDAKLREYEKQRLIRQEEEEKEFREEQKREQDRIDTWCDDLGRRSRDVLDAAHNASQNLRDRRVKEHLSSDARKFLKDEIDNIEFTAEHLNDQYPRCDQGHAVRKWILDYNQKKAEVIQEFTQGIADGVRDKVYETAEVAKAIYEDPRLVKEMAKGLLNLARHPTEFFKHAKGALVQYYHTVRYGNAYERGHAFGDFIGNVAEGYLFPGAKGFEMASLAVNGMTRQLYRFPKMGKHIAKPIIKMLERSPISSDIAKIKRLVEIEREIINDIRNHRILKWRSAEKVNEKIMKEHGYTHPPYEPGTQVIDYVTKRDTEYVRVYTKWSESSQKRGSWVMPKDGIKGLTPEQIQLKYSLPEKPTHVCDVTVPRDTLMSRGRANHVKIDSMLRSLGLDDAKGLSGAIQHRIEGKWEKSWFTNSRLIE